MAQIEQYHEQIQTSMDKLSDIIHRSPLFNTNKKKWKDDCSRLITNITDILHTCEDTIREMPASSVRHYVSKTKNFKKQLDELKEDFQKRMREETIKKDVQDDFDKNEQINTLIRRGDDTQDRTHQAINSMFSTVEQGISLADEINISLNQQIEKMDSIHAKLKDTDSSLKRAQKSINYFVKAMECDKCMLGLLLLNTLALVALVVLLIKKG